MDFQLDLSIKKMGTLVILMLAIAFMLTWYQHNYVSTSYYTKINNQTKQTETQHKTVTYQLRLYGEDNQPIKANLTVKQAQSFAPDTYLKVLYAPKKGITHWEPTSKNQIPKIIYKNF